MEPALRRLVDEHDIRKLVIAFSNGMDARDVAMFRSAGSKVAGSFEVLN